MVHIIRYATVVKLIRASAVVLLSSVIGLVFLQVVARYVFNTSLVWSSELGRYSYVWLVFIGAIYVELESQHITVELFKGRIRPVWAERLLNCIGPSSVIVASIVLSVGSWEWITNEVAGVSPGLGLQMSLVYGVVLLGFVGIGLAAARNLIILFIGEGCGGPDTIVAKRRSGG